MAKKMIRPIRTETEYDEALEEIERYFENDQNRAHRKWIASIFSR
jgi:antitoxin component HigA of HigAB toxin-antitoxin module